MYIATILYLSQQSICMYIFPELFLPLFFYQNILGFDFPIESTFEWLTNSSYSTNDFNHGTHDICKRRRRKRKSKVFKDDLWLHVALSYKMCKRW